MKHNNFFARAASKALALAAAVNNQDSHSKLSHS